MEEKEIEVEVSPIYNFEDNGVAEDKREVLLCL